uniref:Calcium voltage-gated channel auxiliary subunit gamma 6 n=1 Tax=Spermophilus dauricus TaxID=99837 RepID=A0A8C9UNG7_SPEDA
MMWSNFFMQEEDRRRAAAGRRRAQGQKGVLLTPEQEGKIKLVLLLVSIGATLAVLAVGTEFWVELNTYKANSSAVCDAAHLGLWKVCTKRLWLADVPEGRETCGPAELPGEANCTYFKFFTTGENARVFQRTTKKEVNIAAAVIAVLGLVVMALGCLCVIMVLSKGAEFLLRVGAVCFVLSGAASYRSTGAAWAPCRPSRLWPPLPLCSRGHSCLQASVPWLSICPLLEGMGARGREPTLRPSCVLLFLNCAASACSFL